MASPGAQEAERTLLVVEDEDSIRELVATALRFKGFAVTAVASGREALAEGRNGHFDLLVLDVNLPDVNGFEICRKLRADGSGVPVVFLTARDDPADLRAGFTGGGDDYITKPFSLEELVLRIEAVLLACAAALLVAIGICWWVIRQGLKPVDHMVATAAAIADGDLGARIARPDPATELGRLGTALNEMMGKIQTADDARTAGERRLRRFVADAAHELRTPLTSLQGYAELYRQGALADDAAVTNAMGRIESEGARMARLVDDLLLLARLDQDRGLERAAVDVGELVGDAVADFRVVAPDREATFAVEPGTVVLGDRLRLRQIVDNLLANVRTHTPAGTAVRVTVARDGAEAVLTVADSGPGIAAEDQERIFERFWRADPARTRSRGGTGLGLAIVASLVDAHGGSIAIESEIGAGAAFIVRLPLAG